MKNGYFCKKRIFSYQKYTFTRQGAVIIQIRKVISMSVFDSLVIMTIWKVVQVAPGDFTAEKLKISDYRFHS